MTGHDLRSSYSPEIKKEIRYVRCVDIKRNTTGFLNSWQLTDISYLFCYSLDQTVPSVYFIIGTNEMLLTKWTKLVLWTQVCHKKYVTLIRCFQWEKTLTDSQFSSRDPRTSTTAQTTCMKKCILHS